MRVLCETCLVAAVLGITAIPTASAADQKPVPTISQVLAASGIDISGYVDLSGTYSFLGNTTLRVFDTQPHSFNLNMAEVSISKSGTDGFGGAVVLDAGEDADVIAPSGTSNTDQFNVQQAYLSYTSGPASVMFGKMATLIGAEVIESPDNWNFSRSFLFGYAIPFTHTGVRGKYEVSKALSVTLGVNNGWDNLKDLGTQKDVEWQVAFSPSDRWYANVQGIVGSEPGAGSRRGTRNLVDFVGGYNVTKQLAVMANVDYGTQENGTVTGGTAGWVGFAGYAKYDLTEQWSLALRGEYFNDQDGFRTDTAQKLKEFTFTVGYAPVSSVVLRAEYRHDWSNKAVFAKENGVAKSKSQNTLAIEGIYRF